MLLFFLSSLLFLSNSLSLDKLPARETVADNVKIGVDDVMMHIQMVMQNQTGNSKSLIETLEKLDPATIASVVVLIEQLLASAAADLLALQEASELSISAYNDANGAHDAAVVEKVRLDEAILAHQASLAQQLIVVSTTLDTKNIASGAKINAQATLDAESPRLNGEHSTLTQVLELINGLTTDTGIHYQNGNGYKLIAISNGAGGSNPEIDMSAEVNDPFVGEYVKPLYATFNRLRYECGYSESGVLGYIELAGSWTWSEGGFLTASGSISKVEDNVVWDPKLPGWGGQSDAPWSNHIGGVHYPNFGVNGFGNVDGQQWGGRYAFTCNPQSSAFGNGDRAWASGSGTKFVRLFLKPE